MPRPVSRRVFLAGAASAFAVACSGDDAAPASTTTTSLPSSTTIPNSTASTTTTRATVAAPPFDVAGNPFALGVASGEPLADSVVLDSMSAEIVRKTKEQLRIAFSHSESQVRVEERKRLDEEYKAMMALRTLRQLRHTAPPPVPPPRQTIAAVLQDMAANRRGLSRVKNGLVSNKTN